MLTDDQGTHDEIYESVRDRVEAHHPGVLVAVGGIGAFIAYGITGTVLAPVGIGLAIAGYIYQDYRKHDGNLSLLEEGKIEPLLDLLKPRERRLYEKIQQNLDNAKQASTELALSKTGTADVKQVSPVGQSGVGVVRPTPVSTSNATPSVPNDELSELEKLEISQRAANRTRQPEPEEPAKPVHIDLDSLESQQISVEWFDLSTLRDINEYPIIAVIADMGGGKSRLVKYLAKHLFFADGLPEDATVFDVYGDPDEWEGFKIVSKYEQMAQQMEVDERIIDTRIGRYRAGVRSFSGVFRVLEEASYSIPKIKGVGKKESSTFGNWMNMFGSITRKVNARAVVVSVDLVADMLGMSADRRDGMTIIFPGIPGIQKAISDNKMLKLGSKQNEPLRKLLVDELKSKQLQRPAIVYSRGRWYACEIPRLDAGGNPVGGVSARKTTPPVPAEEPKPVSRFEQCAIAAEVRNNRNAASFLRWLGKQAGTEIELRKIAIYWGNKQEPKMGSKERLEPLIRAAIALRLMSETSPQGEIADSNRTFRVFEN